MRPRLAKVSIRGSRTALEREYRAFDAAIARTGRKSVQLDCTQYAPAAVETVRELWRARMAAEHRSSTVFSDLAAQLAEANATIDAKTTMLRMAADELRHTETCGEVVAALGGEPTCIVDVSPVRLPRHPGCSPEERALRNVIYTTCLSEMIAVARLVDELERTREPFLRDAIRGILADEVVHGQFGFHYLRAWRAWLDGARSRRASLERYLAHGFAVLERELRPSGSRREPSRDERRLGVTDDGRAREIFDETVRGAIVPGLEAVGVKAERAWQRRRIVGAR